MITINGFSRPMHPFQILSYFLFLELTVSYYLLIVPNYHNLIPQIISAVTFFILSMTITYSGFMATYMDPTDSQVISERQQKQKNILVNYIASEQDFFCNQCDSHVSGTSKHCRICDRCVMNFDHHCKWLNNCIGQKNYHQFFRLIVCVTVLCCVFIGFALPQLVLILKLNLASKIWLWINVAITAIMLFLSSNLLFFHLWLKKKNLSTYDYIMNRRESKQRLQLAKHAMTLKTMHSNLTDILTSPRTSSSDLFCSCIRKNPKSKIGIMNATVENNHFEDHKIIEFLNNKGLCNEVEVVKLQSADDQLPKKVSIAREDIIPQIDFQSPTRINDHVEKKQSTEQNNNVEDEIQRARKAGNSLTENSNNDDQIDYQNEFFRGDQELDPPRNSQNKRTTRTQIQSLSPYKKSERQK